MTLQVYILQPNQLPVAFGPVVYSLEQARVVVKTLDWMFECGVLGVFDNYTRDSEIRVRTLDFKHSWAYMDQDPSGASDGIWDPC